MPSIRFPTQGREGTNITMISEIHDFEDLIGDNRYGPPPIQEVLDRSHGACPLIILVDQHGWIYEHDDKGDIHKTTRSIREPQTTTWEPEPDMNEDHIDDHVPLARGDNEPQPATCEPEPGLDAEHPITPTSPSGDTHESHMNHSPHDHPEMFRLYKDPRSLLGTQFWKTFDGYDPCEGKITEYHPKEGLWTAEYTDGDQEDFDINDMINHVLGSPPIPSSDEPEIPHPTDESIHQRLSTSRLYTCKEGENFLNICDSIGIPLHHRKLYYEWLGNGFGMFGELWDPSDPDRIGIYFNHPWQKGRRTIFRQGTKFPIPHGDSWDKLTLEQISSGNHHNPEWVAIAATNRSSRKIVVGEWLKHTLMKEERAFNSNSIIDKLTGKIIPPKSISQAMNRPDKDLWKTAIMKEIDALDELKVLSHNHKMSEVRKMGITTTAVPMQLLFDVKYHPDGTLDKYKVRDVVNGHKGYMRRGEHFFNTFSASPSCRTTRLLQAITIGTNLKRYAWDIATAYLWADVLDKEKIAIRYPKEFRRYDEKTGEEVPRNSTRFS